MHASILLTTKVSQLLYNLLLTINYKIKAKLDEVACVYKHIRLYLCTCVNRAKIRSCCLVIDWEILILNAVCSRALYT